MIIIKKSILAFGAIGIAMGVATWAEYRKKKYPLDKELSKINVTMPLFILNEKFLMKANAHIRKMELPKPLNGILRKTDYIKSKDGEQIKITIYEPEKQDKSLPCLVYFHGGGLVLEDASYIHTIVMEYAKKTNCKVIFPHYRTADASPFPTPFYDCYAALEHAWNNAKQLGIDTTKIAVGGDSAGGTVAASAALIARDEGKIPLCFQLLVYPSTDNALNSNSMKKCTNSPVWNSRLTEKVWKIILRNGDFGLGNYISPLHAENLKNLPDAYIETEEFDCLHDDGIAYAKALEKAGNTVQLCDVKGTCHGFDFLVNTGIAKRQIDIRCNALIQAFLK